MNLDLPDLIDLAEKQYKAEEKYYLSLLGMVTKKLYPNEASEGSFLDNEKFWEDLEGFSEGFLIFILKTLPEIPKTFDISMTNVYPSKALAFLNRLRTVQLSLEETICLSHQISGQLLKIYKAKNSSAYL